MKTTWPKSIPELTSEQERIKRDFIQHWYEILPRRYGLIEKFNHSYPVRNSLASGRVLEIGAGLGEHIAHEDLSDIDYYAVEIVPSMAESIKRRFPDVTVINADCQEPFQFPDGYFDRVNAIHILEHLPNLPETLKEVHRTLKESGVFCVVIPCEGGLAYSLARRVSTQRIFKKRYKMSADWLYRSEHVNMPYEIIEELRKYFFIKKRAYFPFVIPSVECNLVIGMILSKRR